MTGKDMKYFEEIEKKAKEEEERLKREAELCKSLKEARICFKSKDFKTAIEKYHHIIDPETLFPKNNFTSVSILTPDSGVADAVSTACFNLSLEEGMALIESMENTEAMWVEPDGTIHFSSGFEAYVQPEQ